MKSQRILFLVIPEKGHINPAIGVAQHLQAVGFHVAFHSQVNIEEQLEKAGLHQFLAPPLTSEDSPHRGKAFSENIRDPAWLRDWIKRMLIDGASEAVSPLREVMKAFQPDLVISDPMIYPAVIAAKLEAIPWVALSNSLNPLLSSTMKSDLLDTVLSLSHDRDDLFSNFGLTAEFRGCDAISPALTIAFTTEEFSGVSLEGIAQVGPSLPLHQRGDEIESLDWAPAKNEAPLIYASFGSQVFYQPDFFLKIIEAVRGKEVRLIAAIHELQDDQRLHDLPPNVTICGYAPQLEILQHANLLITHGGANSVMEALATATPVLIQPICNDQFHQSWFVENAGCGTTIDLDKLTSDELWAKIQHSIEDPQLNARVREVAASYQRDGAKNASELISQLIIE